MQSNTVTREEWLAARLDLLAEEKAFTSQRDALSARRRALPRVRLEKDYSFEDTNGPVTLAGLFDGQSQLIVYHFMFGPDWEEGCPSCSFWADNYDGIATHLAHRDTSLVTIARAPIAKLQTYRDRMGWKGKWVSSLGSDFNYDFNVSFDADDQADRKTSYNFGLGKFSGPETPGISVFSKGTDGAIYHTYSTYSRGLDMLNGAYHFLDLTPKGRDEDGLDHPMSWLRRHDQY